jgi:phosphatidylglycerophosphate synthase
MKCAHDRSGSGSDDANHGVSAPVGYRAALDRLSSAQKPGAGEPAYLRWVNRPIGRRFAAVAFVLGMTPNQVTAVSGAVSVLGLAVVAFVPVSWTSALAAAGLLLLGYALDSADGQLARLRRSGNRAGEWLDHVVDAARLPALHLALAWSFLHRDAPASDLAAGLALCFSLVSSVWFFGQVLAGQLMPVQSAAQKSASRASSAWVSFVKVPYDVGTLYLSIVLLPVWSVFLPLYAAFFAVATAGMAISLRRKWSALRVTVREPR